MKSYAVEKARHLVLRGTEGDELPGTLAKALADEVVTCGWFRASGVLLDVELRAFDAPWVARRIAGPVLALSLEGSVAMDGSEVSIGLRAVLARETERGMETLGGEIVAARVVALEAFVTAFDDLPLSRTLDPKANVVLLGEGVATAPTAPRTEVVPAAAPSRPAVTAPSSTWSDTIAASAEQEARQPAANRGALGGAIPLRPARPAAAQEESYTPEAGDIVEHFAFGRSEVVKSDGERLHLRAGKEGRIREIALEMLKVTPLEPEGGQRRFRLDRRM